MIKFPEFQSGNVLIRMPNPGVQHLLQVWSQQREMYTSYGSQQGCEVGHQGAIFIQIWPQIVLHTHRECKEWYFLYY